MNRPFIVGVMGGGKTDEVNRRYAYQLGAMIAKRGWILLNGGRNSGIMEASAHGAADHGGLTVGILPDADTTQASAHIQIPICTGMGSARNTINVLSSDIVVACAGGAGTLSEIALALKHGKTVVTLNFEVGVLFAQIEDNDALFQAGTPEEVMQIIDKELNTALK